MERHEQDIPLVERKITRRNFLKRLVGLSGDGEDATLLDTVKLSTIVALGIAATIPVSIEVKDMTGVNVGNGGVSPEIEHWIKENPIPAFLFICGIGPLWEEGMFRVAPSLVLDQLSKGGTKWGLGIASSTIFAGIHSFSAENPEAEESDGQQKIKVNSLPLYQFSEGMFLWKLVRDRGYLHSIVAHSVMNTTFFATNLLFAPIDGSSQPSQKNSLSSASGIRTRDIFLEREVS